MEYTTEIDKVVIKVELDGYVEQMDTLNLLLGTIIIDTSLRVEEHYLGNSETDCKEYLIYSNSTNTLLGSVATETIANIYNSFEDINVITLKFDKLKKYNEIADRASFMCLLNCCITLNQRFIDFYLTEVGICLDAVCAPDHTIGMKLKRSVLNKAKKYEMAKVVGVSNQSLDAVRRLGFTLSVEGFNHTNVNIQALQEATSPYDFFYYNYEDAFRKAEENLYKEHNTEEINMKEMLTLNMAAIESFMGTLFFSYGYNT